MLREISQAFAGDEAPSACFVCSSPGLRGGPLLAAFGPWRNHAEDDLARVRAEFPSSDAPSEASRAGPMIRRLVVAGLAASLLLPPFEENESVNGGVHPEISPIPGRRQVLFGTHLVRVPFGFHVTYDRHLDPEETSSGRDWINFTFEYRF
jgi:hypothetical protein